MRIYMFAILDKAKPDKENIERLKPGGGQAYGPSSVLQPELPLIRHNLLYEPGLKEA
jgi:hypothetical protein